MPATIRWRPLHTRGFCRYAAEEGIVEHSPVANVRRLRLDCESPAAGLDRNEFGAFLLAARLSSPRDHALCSLLALNGLRISEAVDARLGSSVSSAATWVQSGRSLRRVKAPPWQSNRSTSRGVEALEKGDHRKVRLPVDDVACRQPRVRRPPWSGSGHRTGAKADVCPDEARGSQCGTQTHSRHCPPAISLTSCTVTACVKGAGVGRVLMCQMLDSGRRSDVDVVVMANDPSACSSSPRTGLGWLARAGEP